jgi:hypothetical protein
MRYSALALSRRPDREAEIITVLCEKGKQYHRFADGEFCQFE